MDSVTKSYFEDLQSQDKDIRYEAFIYILKSTEEKVEWTYEVWDKLIDDLTDANNHRRAIAAQLLSNLSISDPEKRILKDFPALMEVTKDKRFVTARHSLQSIWKVGLAGEEQKEMVVSGLKERYKNCINEKNYTLIRYDIIKSLKKLDDHVQDDSISKQAIDLIELEEDNKYQKKYASVWKNKK
ncbi:hypothetical protein ACFQ3N_15075 [Virgibacillus byunsanensis]|uniref:HEAT repeat domain-containing protein n=1 Tax=Virgibacillus byunsanensis TaxID=570945 RepID=A0ABW3LNN0_9BACI